MMIFIESTHNPYDARNCRQSTGHNGYMLLHAVPLSVPLKAPTVWVFTRRTRSYGNGVQPYLSGLPLSSAIQMAPCTCPSCPALQFCRLHRDYFDSTETKS